MSYNSKSARLLRSVTNGLAPIWAKRLGWIDQLTEEEKDFFRAANWFWESSDVPLFRTIEDIQDTGGAMEEGNRVILVPDVHQLREHVSASELARISERFKEVLNESDNPYFFDNLPSVSDWFEDLGLPTENSYGILIKTEKETGSEDYPVIESGDIDLADLIELIG